MHLSAPTDDCILLQLPGPVNQLPERAVRRGFAAENAMSKKSKKQKLTLRDTCRLCLDGRLSSREIGRLAGVSATTATKYRNLSAIEGITDQTLGDFSNEQLEELLQAVNKGNQKDFVEPNWQQVYDDYQKRDVTVSLLYAEYVDAAQPAEGQAVRSESSFSRKLREFCERRGLSMRQEHLPGREMYVDFSGKHLYCTDPTTGDRKPVELFVAALGYSQKLFVTAVASQQKADWIEANVRALEYFGGATTMIFPDNLKSAVTKPRSHGSEAVINRSYLDFADHYGTIIVPTRPVKPKDKSLAEIGVRITNIWIIAALRNHTFFSIAEINAAILPLLDRINRKVSRRLHGRSRQDLFEEVEAPKLKPLPARRHEYADWIHEVRVPKDYHIPYRGNSYSAPHHLAFTTVSVSIARTTLKIYSRSSVAPVAVHLLNAGVGQTITNKEHMPEKHRLYHSQNVQDLLEWSSVVGGSVRSLFEALLANPRIPAIHAIRQMSRAQKLEKQYGRSRLVEACSRASAANAHNVDTVANILKNEIDLRPPGQGVVTVAVPVAHANVRGPEAYKGDKSGTE